MKLTQNVGVEHEIKENVGVKHGIKRKWWGKARNEQKIVRVQHEIIRNWWGQNMKSLYRQRPPVVQDEITLQAAPPQWSKHEITL